MSVLQRCKVSTVIFISLSRLAQTSGQKAFRFASIKIYENRICFALYRHSIFYWSPQWLNEWILWIEKNWQARKSCRFFVLTKFNTECPTSRNRILSSLCSFLYNSIHYYSAVQYYTVVVCAIIYNCKIL